MKKIIKLILVFIICYFTLLFSAVDYTIQSVNVSTGIYVLFFSIIGFLVLLGLRYLWLFSKSRFGNIRKAIFIMLLASLVAIGLFFFIDYLVNLFIQVQIPKRPVFDLFEFVCIYIAILLFKLLKTAKG